MVKDIKERVKEGRDFTIKKLTLGKDDVLFFKLTRRFGDEELKAIKDSIKNARKNFPHNNQWFILNEGIDVEVKNESRR